RRSGRFAAVNGPCARVSRSIAWCSMRWSPCEMAVARRPASLYDVRIRRPEDAMKAHRPTIMGTRHMVAACHYLAAEAGFRILESGGNAIDAGVAAGIALGVVQPEYVNFAGVAPIMIYSAKDDRLFTIAGLGPWPKAVTRDYFQKHH